MADRYGSIQATGPDGQATGRRGWLIVNYASSEAAARAVVEKIESKGGRALAVRADVSNPEDHKALFDAAEKAFGKVDVLVNNAGDSPSRVFGTNRRRAFSPPINLNVLAPLLLTQEAARRMGAGGSIVNVSSVVSMLSPAHTAAYNATKGAIDSITRTLAKELGPRQIRVNSINPGLVETEGLHASPLIDARQALAALTPLGCIGQPGISGPGWFSWLQMIPSG